MPEPPAKRDAAVLGFFPVLSRLLGSANSPIPDRSLASNSFRSSSIRFSSFRSSSPNCLVMIRRISGGIFPSITDDKSPPYVSEVTPIALSPQTWASMVSYNRLRAFSCVSDVTASTLINTSMCLSMIRCLFPKRLLSTSTASG